MRSGSFTDADFAGNTFTATVNYGDGTGTHALPLVGTTFTLSHHYTALIGSFVITVTVTETVACRAPGLPRPLSLWGFSHSPRHTNGRSGNALTAPWKDITTHGIIAPSPSQLRSLRGTLARFEDHGGP